MTDDTKPPAVGVPLHGPVGPGDTNQQAADSAFEAVSDTMTLARSAVHRCEKLRSKASKKGRIDLARKYAALSLMGRQVLESLELADQALWQLASPEAKERATADVPF